jgi:hypothetical protein
MIEKDLIRLSEYRKTNDSQLWGVGCSFTLGTGVTVTDRYIQLISDEFDLPLNILAESGSSIPWAADQILRSDIRENDIVIWGLTSPERFTYYDTSVHHINYHSNKLVYKLVPEVFLVSEHLTYQAVISVLQVVNFCSKIKAKLLIGGLLVTSELTEFLESTVKEYFLCVPHYQIHGLGNYIDLGLDNVHPGPLQHKLYAENFINELILRKYI